MENDNQDYQSFYEYICSDLEKMYDTYFEEIIKNEKLSSQEAHLQAIRLTKDYFDYWERKAPERFTSQEWIDGINKIADLYDRKTNNPL